MATVKIFKADVLSEQNVSFQISLWWPIHVINPVEEEKGLMITSPPTLDCRVFQLSSWSPWHLFSISLMPVFQVPTNAKVHKLTSYLLLTLYLYCIIATGICSIGTCKFRSFWCIFWTRTSEKFSKLSGLLALKFYLSENYLVLAGLKCVTQIKTKINKNSRLEYLSALEL